MAADLKQEEILTGPYTLKSLQPCDLSNCTKGQILEYFENSYSLNESIFTALKTKDAFYMAPDRLRLPLVFYYAHTAVVYINKLMLAGLIQERVNFEYEKLFETGVDEMSWDDTENYRMGGSYKWPDLSDCVEFRRKVRNVIRQVILDSPLELPVMQDSPWWAVFMGMEHERIHVETSSVLIRQLPVAMVRRPDEWKPGPLSYGESPMKNSFITVEETDVTMGKPRDFPSYGWDNEYPTLQTRVPKFEATKYLISNKEFLEFVRAGGYKQEELWSKEGWQWRTYRQATHPTFWVCCQGCKSGCGGVIGGYSHCQPDTNENDIPQVEVPYRYRSLCEEMSLPLDWPAEVNYHEAKAYAAWRGPEYRLITEAEHHAVRDQRFCAKKGIKSDVIYQEGLHKKFNTNMAYSTSTPVNMFPPSKVGFHDVFGNVWQWTEDHFNGFPGADTHFLYDDFSDPCYDGKHNIILGGSWISTGDEASIFARYAFRRHFFQHAGFRLARSLSNDQDLSVRLVKSIDNEPIDVSLPAKDISKKFYPSTNPKFSFEKQSHMDDILFNEYALGDQNLSSALREVTVAAAKEHGVTLGHVLDLGCACGRSTFELSREADKVVGIDFCGVFVTTAQHLQQEKRKVFYCPKDDCQRPIKRSKKNSHDGCTITAVLPPGTNTERVTFKQFGWIPNELHSFDLVLHHCMDRVPNKKAWLIRLWEILNPGGIAVISAVGGWTKDKLEPFVGNKLECVDTMALRYTEDYRFVEPECETTVSVWRRK